jgi:Fe-S cluster biogenesis protein NfuA
VRLTDIEARERATRVESLLAQLESVDEPARGIATEALGALVELYGEALARLAAHVPAATLAGDDVIGHLLLLHGLHPHDAAARVAQALAEIEPALRRQGAEVALSEISGGVARLTLRTGSGGCQSQTLRTLVEDAVRSAGPDLDRIEIETVTPPPALIPLESIRLRRPASAGDGAAAAGVR